MGRILYILLFGCLLIVLVACQSKEKGKALHIAAASSMSKPLQELVKAFEEKTNYSVITSTGSSGTLTTQLLNGASFDFFLSADSSYPHLLHKELRTHDLPALYARGTIVLWSTKPNIELTEDLLSSPETKHIAIPNPKLAPYGIAAMTYLTVTGKDSSLLRKLVLGESVSQTNQFIASGSADAGITSRSSVTTEDNWIALDTSLYVPTSHYCLLIPQKGIVAKEATEFQDFLLSEDGKKILTKFGFLIDESP